MFAIITQKGLLNCHRDICPKEAEVMANSVDTDLIAPFGAVLLIDLFFMKTLIHYVILFLLQTCTKICP